MLILCRTREASHAFDFPDVLKSVSFHILLCAWSYEGALDCGDLLGGRDFMTANKQSPLVIRSVSDALASRAVTVIVPSPSAMHLVRSCALLYCLMLPLLVVATSGTYCCGARSADLLQQCSNQSAQSLNMC